MLTMIELYIYKRNADSQWLIGLYIYKRNADNDWTVHL